MDMVIKLTNLKRKGSQVVLITIALLLVTFVLPTSAQSVKVDCCGIKVTIPVFVETPIPAEQSILVDKGIIPSIKKSDAQLEIRLSRLSLVNPFNTTVTVFKCKDNFISRITYTTSGDVTAQPNSKDMGTYKGGTTHVMLSVLDNSADKSVASYDEFFQRLVNNHMFDLEGGDKVSELWLWDYPHMKKDMSSAVTIEMKVGNKFRYYKFIGTYPEPVPTTLDEMNFYRAFYKLLSTL
jgi:hypothetical protein